MLLLTARHGGEACNASEICPDGMTCREGVCICNIGKLTPDGYRCLLSTEKLLGQQCNPSTDVCLQKASECLLNVIITFNVYI